MGTVAAIDVSSGTPLAVLVETGRGESLYLKGWKEIPAEFFKTALLDSESADGSSDSPVQDPLGTSDSTESAGDLVAEQSGEFTKGDTTTLTMHLPTTLDLGILATELEDILAIAPSTRVIYNTISLPFSDQKKVEAVAPLQLQDSLPFELDGFICDTLKISQVSAVEWRFITSCLPEQEIKDVLSTLTNAGYEPRILTSRASAISCLAKLSQADRTTVDGYLAVDGESASLVIFKGNTIILLRELPIKTGEERELLRSLSCSIARVETEDKVKFEALFILTDSDEIFNRAAELPFEIARWELPKEIVFDSEAISSNSVIPNARFACVAGAILAEQERKRNKDLSLVDFRHGPFTYRRAWQELRSALSQELLYIILFTISLIAWVGGHFYYNYSQLSEIEDAIDSRILTVLPEETPPEGDEVSFMQGKVDELEENLRSTGSLSALSPLDSIKEISEAVGTSTDLIIDNITVGHSRFTLTGSVPNNIAVDQLNTSLNSRKARFCKIRVDPRGKVMGTRVGVQVEIELCE